MHNRAWPSSAAARILTGLELKLSAIMTRTDTPDVDLFCYDTRADAETAKNAPIMAGSDHDLALASIQESRHRQSCPAPAPACDRSIDPHDADLLCCEAQIGRKVAKDAPIKAGNNFDLALTSIFERRHGYKHPRTKPRYTYDEPIGFKGMYGKRNADDE